MRLRVGRAGWRRGLLFPCVCAVALALSLCVGPASAPVRAQGGTAIASAGEAVLLREQPGYDAAALATLADGALIEVVGEVVVDAAGLAWAPVVANGQSGYVPAGYVGAATAGDAAPVTDAPPPPDAAAEPVAVPVPDPAAPLPATGTATTVDANLRSGPSTDAPVILVLAQGTAVSVDGEPANGFVPVSADGVSGWLLADLLTGGGDALPAPAAAPDAAAPPADEVADPALPAPVVAESVAAPPAAPAAAPEAARGASTNIGWPMAGGEWEVVQGYNNGTHTNRSSFAQYKYSLDWARVDGNTAGQTVYAPVSGTIRWIDRGSGGMLVDAGNGYGVAVFHVTIDRGLSRGGTVERGQPIGTVSGPGGEGYMSMPHIDITCWRLTRDGHESVPFTGPNAIAGQEFPDVGGANQHMGATVLP
jgi:murein DD-endopeptidase MepM/ murein hydrolase activator NlpD